jgi:hypothetical protein
MSLRFLAKTAKEIKLAKGFQLVIIESEVVNSMLSNLNPGGLRFLGALGGKSKTPDLDQ